MNAELKTSLHDVIESWICEKCDDGLLPEDTVFSSRLIDNMSKAAVAVFDANTNGQACCR